MTIDFQFTLDDYRNAFRTHFRTGASAWMRWMLRFCLVVGVVFLLIGILFVVTGQRALNVALPPFVFGAFWVWIGAGGSYRLSAKNQFSRSPMLREPRRMEFSENGIKTDAGLASSEVSWKAFIRYVESKDSFLLYTSPACFNIIPKRALQPGQVDALRRLLNGNVGIKAAAQTA